MKKISRRDLISGGSEGREAVRQEIEAVGASQITDVLSWQTDEFGQISYVSIVPSDQLPERARRGIKKIKVTPTAAGNQVEIEMHDKLGALRLLARAEGLLDGMDDADKRPSLVGINLRGPRDVVDGESKSDGQDEAT
tara:strand:+ start:1551 stop:1964 length:414 start_codon:yes stop_codon:yes gene_type:complete